MRNYTGPRAEKNKALCDLIDLAFTVKEARKEKLKLKRADRKEVEELERKWRNRYKQLSKK